MRTRARTSSLKAASATPGVVAGNDVAIAEKTAEASQQQVAERPAERRGGASGAARGARHRSVPPHHGAVRGRGHRAERASRRAGRPRAGLVRRCRCFDWSRSKRLRLVIPVPETYTAVFRPARDSVLRGRRTRDRCSPARSRGHRAAVDVHDADHGDRTGRRQSATAGSRPASFCQVRWPVRRARAIAVRAERERGGDDRPDVRHPRRERQDRVGRRQDRPHVGHARRGLRRSYSPAIKWRAEVPMKSGRARTSEHARPNRRHSRRHPQTHSQCATRSSANSS